MPNWVQTRISASESKAIRRSLPGHAAFLLGPGSLWFWIQKQNSANFVFMGWKVKKSSPWVRSAGPYVYVFFTVWICLYILALLKESKSYLTVKATRQPNPRGFPQWMPSLFSWGKWFLLMKLGKRKQLSRTVKLMNGKLKTKTRVS